MSEYFVGIRLPQGLEEACEKYRRAFRAPRTVAHITVIAPFSWEKSPGELRAIIDQAVRPLSPFTIAGKGLGSFGTRVLFVNVELSNPLRELHTALTHSLAQAGVEVERRPYHPHITLATRLRPHQFARYKQELGGFSPEYAFTCEAVSLFTFTNDRRWEEREVIVLGG